jgi:hypothetical protein
MIQACYVEETYCHYKTILNVNPLPEGQMSMKYLTGLLNSRLLSFVFPFISNKMVAQSFPRLSVGDIKHLPIVPIDFSKRKEKAKHDRLIALVDERLSAQAKARSLPSSLAKRIHQKNRTPCNLAHYLKKDFAAAVKPEILINDVQRAGFVHEIVLESNGRELTLTAMVADTQNDAARPWPVLRLSFKDDSLRQFVYACWRLFLAEHSRQKRWTKGKKPEAIYPLLVNGLEPLVYFEPTAGDNLRAVGAVMKAVAEEAGTADLAAVEAEIEKLDREIDDRVYELYGLTPEEIKAVKGEVAN